ncbi:MAG: hypothetical protein ACREH6_02720 [Geminicoccaceae bacterium]
MGALSSLASVGLNLALAQQAAKRQSRAIDSERDRRIGAIQLREDEEQRQREDTLRRRLAAQRARAGAAGVARGGSSEAVLRGLVQEAEASQEASNQAAAGQISNLRRRASRSRRGNLLDLVGGATQGSLNLFGRSSSRRRSLLDF